ncbi:MAG: hypothetical protein ACREX3_20895, partial [Gammaproteobacteria bacterium]
MPRSHPQSVVRVLTPGFVATMSPLHESVACVMFDLVTNIPSCAELAVVRVRSSPSSLPLPLQ